jgi:hypothetical protein
MAHLPEALRVGQATLVPEGALYPGPPDPPPTGRSLLARMYLVCMPLCNSPRLLAAGFPAPHTVVLLIAYMAAH